ncbi:MAG: hypothetical protein QOK10_770 [Pseudonocardiales bacterium]|nr:hypothetical protein [Pseudonocardiales bacterium]
MHRVTSRLSYETLPPIAYGLDNNPDQWPE